MDIKQLVFIEIFVLLYLFFATSQVNSIFREKRTLIYQEDSLFGIFLAIAVPIELPDRNVFVSYNFESNYPLPYNISAFSSVYLPNAPIASRKKRSLTREVAYKMLETKFKDLGMSGKECLLKNICETSETPLHHTNGVLGHLMHIIFTPSTSQEEPLDNEYYLAELHGRSGDCTPYEKKCPFSLFDAISIITETRAS